MLAVSSRRWNSLKMSVRLRFGDAGAGVAHLDAEPCRRAAARRAAPCPSAVYLMALETRFCSTRRSRRRSERTQARVGTMRRSSPFSRASGANSTSSRSNTSFKGKTVMSGSSRPVSRREISISTLRISSTASSEASMLRGERRLLPAERALDQARHVEPRRIERLQHVVACRRQEARLVEVGLVGLALGDRQRLVDLGQLGRALAHAPLQRLVGARQRLGGLDALGDVGIGGDDAALRHRAGADLEDAPAAVDMLLEGLVRHGELHEPLGDELVDVAGAEIAALGARAQDAGRAARRPGRARPAGSAARGTAGSSRSAACPCRTRSGRAAPGRAPTAAGRGCTAAPRRHRRAGAGRTGCRHRARRSSSDSTSREEAAPMALASRCSVKRSRWMSASASGADRRAAAFGKLGKRPLRALGAEIAGDRVLQVAGRDRRCATAGRPATSAGAAGRPARTPAPAGARPARAPSAARPRRTPARWRPCSTARRA